MYSSASFIAFHFPYPFDCFTTSSSSLRFIQLLLFSIVVAVVASFEFNSNALFKEFLSIKQQNQYQMEKKRAKERTEPKLETTKNVHRSNLLINRLIFSFFLFCIIIFIVTWCPITGNSNKNLCVCVCMCVHEASILCLFLNNNHINAINKNNDKIYLKFGTAAAACIGGGTLYGNGSFAATAGFSNNMICV